MAPVPGPREGLNAAVAAQIRAEAAAARLSDKALAEKAGVNYASLRRWLGKDKGNERHIDVAVLAELARAVGSTSAEIVAGAEERLGRIARWEAEDADGQTYLVPEAAVAPRLDADLDEADELAQKRASRRVPSDLPGTITDEDLIGQPSVAEPVRNDVEGNEAPEET
ncbi:hypothetical protein F9L07_22825 [Pimelobacter simplex]|uniref:Uncharacterized protein n=1 Tax=Nocardioides simplex TaxID=2045 RepID=A0A7J5DT78_NOCSI|nr:hypothetical protein [Pimelobacter simplex]KAB2808353.1 hypothetical protein F9L07_22825 [Pimelobacter simplex]